MNEKNLDGRSDSATDSELRSALANWHMALNARSRGKLVTAMAPVELARALLAAEAQLAAVRTRVAELEALLNTPQVADWTRAVQLEAGHQRERWGSEHNAGKAPADWFWLLGYLGGKALQSAVSGNTEKALHHTISAGAALANWHMALTGADTSMRPGIAEPLTPAPSPGAGGVK